ncbi:hypothetical protein HanRHA438_Chr14g0648491 [Helianthus annuus]|uniref:Uncharacterized protein n=1 Tax=Helianthus annuus TaxID=4232 RepID=A0A9K3E846_HELAN|nr:hypothetical protein HanXRQr2_Chr14g0637961 [Helianthus annuus]KAJ0839869.1 hypothetical protein HanPSC8_Chr14g0611901 [Helianthus annuus]KAJ0853207.1 hypothetical protein HanRHA438_Chr14g0648491 [Helianthus annuus]
MQISHHLFIFLLMQISHHHWTMQPRTLLRKLEHKVTTIFCILQQHSTFNLALDKKLLC